MQDILSKLQLYLVQNGRKQSTIRLYTVLCKRLLVECPHLDQEEIVKFLLTLQQEGKRHSYMNQHIDLLRVINHFHPTYYPPYFKNQSFIKATLSDEEIERFLSIPAKRKGKKEIHNHERWTLFFSIMAYSGMRPGEVANLTVDTVDFGRGVFLLEDTKTNTPRFVPIAPNIQSVLVEYVKNLQTNYLFPSMNGGTHKGNVVDNVDWHYNFWTRMKRLGIKRKNLSPYSLRHSLITRLLEEDVNIFKVQKIVGHRQLSTTAQYTHLTTKDIQVAITKHPLIRRSTNPQAILKSITESIKAFSLENDPRFTFFIEETEQRFKIEVGIK